MPVTGRAAARRLSPRFRRSWRDELGIANLDWVVAVDRARRDRSQGAGHRAAAAVRRSTARIVYQIGMPWHFGWEGYATGDIANILTSVVGDPNTSIHEGKALTCNLRKGRLRSRRS